MSNTDYANTVAAQGHRDIKIAKLIMMASGHGVTASDMAIMNDEQWKMLEKAAGVNKCSQITRDQAIQTYRNVEAARKRTATAFPKYTERGE
jgi:hypothetical protein